MCAAQNIKILQWGWGKILILGGGGISPISGTVPNAIVKDLVNVKYFYFCKKKESSNLGK